MDINKSNNMQTAILPETEMTATISHNKRPLIVVQHNCLGHVEAPEGCRLMANLLDQFVELEALPTAVILQGRLIWQRLTTRRRQHCCVTLR